jgi:hypothetical protein
MGRTQAHLLPPGDAAGAVVYSTSPDGEDNRQIVGGAPRGFATLDATGKIPAAQIGPVGSAGGRIYISGNYYWPEIGTVSAASASMAQDRLYGIPFVVGRATDFVAAVYQGSATTSTRIWLALYAHDENRGPADLIESVGWFPITDLALERTFVAPARLSGIVWLAVVFDAPVLMRSFGGNTALNSAPLGTALNTPGADIDLLAGLSSSFPFGPPPMTFPSAGMTFHPATALPRVGLKV